jgi:hypothetical protein
MEPTTSDTDTAAARAAADAQLAARVAAITACQTFQAHEGVTIGAGDYVGEGGKVIGHDLDAVPPVLLIVPDSQPDDVQRLQPHQVTR